MKMKYTSERAIQMLIWLLKKNNIRKVIVSPGATNANFVSSLQMDGNFEMYSCLDERSAAYMACGLAEATGEVVVITCTGATASREYLAGLTEAYYRKLPILAVTGTQTTANGNNLIPQFIDRECVPKDAIKYSVHIQYVRGETDEWDCMLKMNRAIMELFSHGGGPVHINLTTNYSIEYCVGTIPPTRKITYHRYYDLLPDISARKRIAISIGAHKPFTKKLTYLIDKFCELYDAVVLVDHSSKYYGKWRVLPTLYTAQKNKIIDLKPDLIIHIGEQSADYFTFYWLRECKEVWRVSEDGKIRDTFKALTNVCEMREEDFFEYYVTNYHMDSKKTNLSYYEEWQEALKKLYNNIPQLPFSNIYIAKRVASEIRSDSVVQLGLSNTMRAWTFFEFGSPVYSGSNVGCRGIDGVLSTLVGISLSNRTRICYGIFGDLTFFYDMNVLCNRHIGNNIRLMLINNNGGTEFHIHGHMGYLTLKDEVGKYVAADGHAKNKSRTLLKHYTEDLGFTYLWADDKESLERALKIFLSEELGEKPIFLEVFTGHELENDALDLMQNIQ